MILIYFILPTTFLYRMATSFLIRLKFWLSPFHCILNTNTTREFFLNQIWLSHVSNYRIKFKFCRREKSHSSLILYPSLLPCILSHISYSGLPAQNTTKPFYCSVPLLILFPLLGICFLSLYMPNSGPHIFY